MRDFSRRSVSRRSLLRFGLAAAPAFAAGLSAVRSVEAVIPANVPSPWVSLGKTQINGKLSIVQSRDFHPDHNTFVEKKIKEFADMKGYPLDHSYIEGYVGAGNIVQKLTAAVQANDAPDIVVHTLLPANLQYLEVIEDVDSLMGEVLAKHGNALPAIERRSKFGGKWWGVPNFSRAGGYWVRETPFKDAGIDWRTDLTDFDKARELCLKASKPDKELWGWGNTLNRSGDGEYNVFSLVMMSGGQIADDSGQLVVLNKDPYRQYALTGLEWLKETFTDPKWAPMLPPGVNAWTDPSNNEAYLAGKIFFSTNAGTMFAKAILDKNPVAEDTYLTTVPKGPGPAGRTLQGAGDPMYFFIMKGAKNRGPAEEMIRYFLQEDVLREMFKISTGYVYPAYDWGWDDPVIRDDKFAQHVTPAWRKIAYDPSGFTGAEFPGPPTPQVASLLSANFWTDMMGEIINGKSPADALKSGHDRAVRVFKEFGAKGE